MKDYTIWLKSGQIITGQMETDKCQKLKNAFREGKYPIHYQYEDQDGFMMVDVREIAAVYYGDPPKINNNQVGFGPPGTMVQMERW